MTVGVLHLGRTGAGPQLALSLAKALRDSGVEQVVMVTSANAEIAIDVKDVGVPHLAVRTFTSARGAVVGSVRIPHIAAQIDAFLDENRVDVLIVAMEQIWQGLMAPRIGRGRQVLLMVHDGTMHPGEKSRMGEWLRRRERTHAHGAIVLTEHVRSVVVARGEFAPENVWLTVHPAFEVVHQPEPRQLPSSRPVRIGFFGRMSTYKGLRLGVQAIEDLRRRGLDVEFHVAGRNIDRGIPRIHAAGNFLDDRWIPQSEVGDLVASFDIALLPYTEASQSGVLAYSMAAGVPAVVTPVGGLVEQATESGSALIAREVSAVAVADEVERLIDSPTLYEALSAGALRASARAFSWSRVATDITSAIDQLRSRTQRTR